MADMTMVPYDYNVAEKFLLLSDDVAILKS